ncbi:MAG: SHOCT domain-containing protein [Phycisphaerae bacterium]|nr:SHOCT domain-containing protein [Phycisphaerae bacterium]
MRKLVLCALLATMPLLIQGCASSTGVLPMGPDTYTVTGQSEFGPGYAQKKALKDANAFAVADGKHMIPTTVQTRSDFDSFGDRIHVYELTFRLVDSDDPEYKRTNLQRLPDKIIRHEKVIDADVTIDNSSESDDIYTQLMKLKALKDDGILTEEEFQQEKKRVIERR